MPVLFWDASALLKRYYTEIGSDTVDVLFTTASPSHRVVTFWGYAEIHATLWRKHNGGAISLPLFRQAVTLLRSEVLQSLDWKLLSIDDALVLAGIDLVERHNLNTSDAAILETYLRFARSQPPNAPTAVLVAADARLLRAANAEGLTTLNPEAVAAADVPALLSTL